ncbi:hypothetical protein FBU59_002761 [Linderina macrospora]|uniref:Uncharacterized protein n=1 Tax=Linderina macrospora TaxID=4868 RepID=A0ACC1JAA1_9FUNG|nr:hypothetical protein FBU59_002761 [Linderina macrospora]
MFANAMTDNMLITEKVRALIDSCAVTSAPDLVAALSEAVLHAHNFAPAKPSSWISPGLPKNTHMSKFNVNGDKQVEVKWTDVAGKLMVFAAVLPAKEGDEPVVHTAQLSTAQYITKGTTFPLRLDCNNEEEFSQQLTAAVSNDALSQLTKTVINDIVRKVIPANDDTAGVKPSLLVAQDRDSSDFGNQGNPSGVFGNLGAVEKGPGNPLEIGRSDLDPLGGRLNDPASGGMFVGPGHSIFGGNQSREDRIPAGPSFLPPGAVPAGARFDPISPFGDTPRPARPGPSFGGRSGGSGGGPGGFSSGSGNNGGFFR